MVRQGHRLAGHHANQPATPAFHELPCHDAIHQARFLSWEHLSREQVAAIRAAPKQPGAPTARQLLQQYVSEQLGEDQLRNDIVLDMFAYTLQQGQVSGDMLSTCIDLTSKAQHCSC